MFGTSRVQSMRFLKAVTIGLLAATAACDQATAPASVTLDANATLADYQALDQMFASDGFAGVRALAGRTPMSASTDAEATTPHREMQLPEREQVTVSREMTTLRAGTVPSRWRTPSADERLATYTGMKRGRARISRPCSSQSRCGGRDRRLCLGVTSKVHRRAVGLSGKKKSRERK